MDEGSGLVETVVAILGGGAPTDEAERSLDVSSLGCGDGFGASVLRGFGLGDAVPLGSDSLSWSVSVKEVVRRVVLLSWSVS